MVDVILLYQWGEGRRHNGPPRKFRSHISLSKKLFSFLSSWLISSLKDIAIEIHSYRAYPGGESSEACAAPPSPDCYISSWWECIVKIKLLAVKHPWFDVIHLQNRDSRTVNARAMRGS